jgi:hypothetical protein
MPTRYVLLAFDNGEDDTWFYLTASNFKPQEEKNGRVEPRPRR